MRCRCDFPPPRSNGTDGGRAARSPTMARRRGGGVVGEVWWGGYHDTADVRAVRVSTGGVVWGDEAVASAFTDKVVAEVAAQPSVAVAAVLREAGKVTKYASRLPAAEQPAVFTPLVYKVIGRVGPASVNFLRTTVAAGRGARKRLRCSLQTRLLASGATTRACFVRDFCGVMRGGGPLWTPRLLWPDFQVEWGRGPMS
eukprot:TRINITY_DN1180_c0_g1_i20.p1 TRINITY_DN1180_c0_g1~~TRINITY_DN1180_c0_g1_i20.p1  ORF type:complete len:199 (+),score=22.79 TRINITY_DN1180_c0_g1_i20:112-708(+)